ncbi:zinc metalloproteinase-disintegrin-like protein F1 [Babylonia areolata]|uniref:zinc metalloproteinase-disintegrin-like protein F1 n=1 Tax=Babylonia areolata TaxID=304850 RepID=UPI003FD2B7BF
MTFLAKISVFCLLAVLASSVELNEHFDRIVRSEETDGYDIATVHAVDPITNKETRQTKRDIQAHASDADAEDRTFSLRLSSGEQLRMSVQRRSIDFSGAKFTELTEDGERKKIDMDPADCFFSGELENQEGFASLSLCGGEVVGSVSTPTRDYQIHSVLPHDRSMGTPGDDDDMKVLVTWQDADSEGFGEVDDGLESPEDSDSPPETERRSLKDRRATIEICDVVDKYFIADVQRKLGINNSSKIIELLISKWSSAAYMLSNKTQVGWDLNLRLVKVDIMRSHPEWYKAQPHEKMGARLNEICNPTSHWTCDQISLHTGQTSDPRIVGLAWVGLVCNPRRRCSSLRSSNRNYMAELHELGHTLGLKHDGQERRCVNGTDPVHGFMGGNRYHFRECYKEVLATSLANPRKKCIFTDAINTTDIVKDFSD